MSKTGKIRHAQKSGADTKIDGLMTCFPNHCDESRRATAYVDKIVKSATPVDLPVERATKFKSVVILKTAKQIGVTIPPEVLARANRIVR